MRMFVDFVPISKKADEFSVKQDVEKFFRRVRLKAFYHDKEGDSNTSNKDTFETLQFRSPRRPVCISRFLQDIVIKAADKGGTPVVWRAALYQKKALWQLSNTSL